MRAYSVSASAPLAQLRQQALAILNSPEMAHCVYYRSNVEKAFGRRDADKLEIIVWYLSVYLPSVGHLAEITLNDVEEAAVKLRSARRLTEVSHFFTVETLNAVEQLGQSLSRVRVSGYSEVVNEIFMRPESLPVIEHLVHDRGLDRWKDIQPLLDDMLANPSPALIEGVL